MPYYGENTQTSPIILTHPKWVPLPRLRIGLRSMSTDTSDSIVTSDTGTEVDGIMVVNYQYKNGYCERASMDLESEGCQITNVIQAVKSLRSGKNCSRALLLTT